MSCLLKRIASAVLAAAMLSVICVPGKGALAYNAGIEAFVNSLYSDCLGRSADPTGFNDWCNRLTTGSITGKQAAYGFFFSPEFLAKANTLNDSDLIEAYYRVFLNRTSDPTGKAYWTQQISVTGRSDDVAILFLGFSNSTEFASKCQSYGITAGPDLSVPFMGGMASSVSVSTSGASGSSAGTGRRSANPFITEDIDRAWELGRIRSDMVSSSIPAGMEDPNFNMRESGINRPATSPAAMDAFWTAQGYEVWYIDLGNGVTQKCYARFEDMTTHNQLVNNWRAQNGVPAYNVLTTGEAANWTRMRAVECAYSLSHTRPNGARCFYSGRADGYFMYGENLAGCNGGTAAFNMLRDDPPHNALMISTTPTTITTASCEIQLVSADGLSISGCGAGTAQNFWY